MLRRNRQEYNLKLAKKIESSASILLAQTAYSTYSRSRRVCLVSSSSSSKRCSEYIYQGRSNYNAVVLIMPLITK